MISIFFPWTFIFVPSSGGGKMLTHFSAVFRSIHSEKVMEIDPWGGKLTVPIIGVVKRMEGGVLSSGPPLGAICLAQDAKRKRIGNQCFIMVCGFVKKNGSVKIHDYWGFAQYSIFMSKFFIKMIYFTGNGF
jgi:hypothetical protein